MSDEILPPGSLSSQTKSRGVVRSFSFWLIGALALAVGHFAWIGLHLAPAIMSPDANGYVVQGRLVATEGRTSLSTTSPAQFVGIHWLETEGGTFRSRYPAGLPLLFAVAWKIGGLTAVLWINPLLSSLTVLLVFFLARRIMPDAYALFAAAVFATVPVANQHALDADAHIAATFFLLAGVLALFRFDDLRKPGAGILAGLLLGAVPTIRYPEAVVGIAIGAWLLWRVRPIGRIWPAALGAALPICALLIHNSVAYGAFWRTGYALTNEQTGFGINYFASHVLPYLQAFGGPGLALIFAFGTAGLAALAFDSERRKVGVLFVGMVVPLVVVYMAYYFGGGVGGVGASLRFLVPTFPFFAVAGAWLLASIAERLGAGGRAAVIVVVALQCVIGIGGSVATLASAKASLTAAARVRGLAEKEIPAGSVVIVDRRLAESLDAVGRWKLVEENLVAGMGMGPAGFGGPGGGRGGFRPGIGGPEGGEPAAETEEMPNPMQRGKNKAQQARYAELPPEERRKRVWADLAVWAGDKPVFWFARSLDAVDNALPDGADFRRIADVDMPMMMGPGGGRGAGAGSMPAIVGRGNMPGAGGPGRGFIPPGRGNLPGGAGIAGGPGLPGARRGGGSLSSPMQLRVVRIDLPKP